MSGTQTSWCVPSAHRVMPWKNGHGETLEVARSPGGSSLEVFDWRVSIAPVVSDGAFSIFPGIERTIAVIEGAGMELKLAGERTHRLLPGMPFTYDGGLAIDGRLIDGPVRDFNVMARRGRCTGELILAGGPLAVAGSGATIVAYSLQGIWRMTLDAEAGRLEPGGSVATDAAMLSADPRSPGARLAVALLRTV